MYSNYGENFIESLQMPTLESTLGVVRVRVTDQSTGLPSWITLNAAPPVTNNVYEAATEAEMLAFTVKYGYLCVRTDRNTLFVYTNATPPAAPPTVLADWKQVTWSDAQAVADQTAMLALTTSDPGDLAYNSATSELYIRIETAGTGSLITDWLKIGSRPSVHLNVADETAMLALVAEKGDLALRIDQDVTYALHANPATNILNWIQLPGSGSAKDRWVYTASTTASADPGLGNFTSATDAATPPTWTFEISAVDSTAIAHNLAVMKERDTVVLTDVPATNAAPTFFQRFELLAEPTDNVGWYSFTAKPVDVATGTLPAVGSEVAIDLGFGGGAIKVLDELVDVQTLGLTTHPAGPVGGDVLTYDSGAALWVPGPDTHIIHDYMLGSTPPTLPDGSELPDGSLWLSPNETAPILGTTTAPIGNKVSFVISEAAMLGLVPQIGDLAIRTDLGEMYAYQNFGGLGPTDLTSWYKVTSGAVQKNVSTVGDGVGTSFDIDHGFGTQNIIVQAWDVTTGDQLNIGAKIVDNFKVRVSFATAPAANSVRVIVSS
jgi:hypothetical protein